MTRIGVQAAPGRARLTMAGEPISPRLLQVTADGARIGLVATSAVLLGGDHVHIEVDVGPGAWLEIVETAGTVAYDAQGVESSWTVRIFVATGGVLIWAGEPFVVADGANVRRSTTIDLAEGAVACLRETLVLGRSREPGGAIRSTVSVTQGGRPLLIEDLDLTEPTGRMLPGIIGGARVIDTVTLLGMRAPTVPDLAVGSRFELDGPGTVARFLHTEFAASPLAPVCATWRVTAHGRVIDSVAEVVTAATTS